MSDEPSQTGGCSREVRVHQGGLIWQTPPPPPEAKAPPTKNHKIVPLGKMKFE